MDAPVLWEPLLRDALAALAAPPDEQVGRDGPGCIACDLLNDFDHARLVAIGNAPLSDGQRAALARIDRQIGSLLPPDLECFNPDVVRRPAWRWLRELAEIALGQFGWEGAEVRGFVEGQPGIWHRPATAG